MQRAPPSQSDDMVHILWQGAGARSCGLDAPVPQELRGQPPEKRLPLVRGPSQSVDPLSVPHGKDARAVAGVCEGPAGLSFWKR